MFIFGPTEQAKNGASSECMTRTLGAKHTSMWRGWLPNTFLGVHTHQEAAHNGAQVIFLHIMCAYSVAVLVNDLANDRTKGYTGATQAAKGSLTRKLNCIRRQLHTI